jgi:hypothetical protein
MITINLLPPELRPIKRTPVPYIVSVAILALIVLMVGAKYLSNRGAINDATELLAKHKEQRDELQPVIDEANELANKKKQLQEQVETISEITSDRIIWSEQMYHLSRLALENLWFHEIEVSPKTRIEMQEIYDPQKKRTKKKRVRVTETYLQVQGYVVPGESGDPRINPFLEAAEEDEEFSRTFDLDPEMEIIDTDFDGNPVREFTIEFKVKSGGNKE